MECECCRRESVVLRCTTHWPLLWVPKGSLARRWGRLGVQHRRFPFTVASPDSLRPQLPRAREAEPPTAKGEGGGPGVSVGGMVGVAIGGGAVGCPCRLGLARRRQVALKSTFADVSQRQNGPPWCTKYHWYAQSTPLRSSVRPVRVGAGGDRQMSSPIRIYSIQYRSQ